VHRDRVLAWSDSEYVLADPTGEPIARGLKARGSMGTDGDALFHGPGEASHDVRLLRNGDLAYRIAPFADEAFERRVAHMRGEVLLMAGVPRPRGLSTSRDQIFVEAQ